MRRQALIEASKRPKLRGINVTGPEMGDTGRPNLWYKAGVMATGHEDRARGDKHSKRAVPLQPKTRPKRAEKREKAQ